MRALPRIIAVALLAAGASACRPPDPARDLEVSDLDAYWAVDPAVGSTNYLAPAVRFSVRSRSTRATGSVQATAVFRRQGEEATWGSDWKQVVPAAQPLAPGQSTTVMMKADARYYSSGTPESFFQHKAFRDANVQVFLREGASGWVKFAETAVERRVGARGAKGSEGTPASPVPVPPFPPSPR